MNRLRPQTLLAILLGAVPLAVLVAGVVAFLLLRAEYGILVWGVLPFLGVLTVVAVLGVVIGRAASAGGGAAGTRRGERVDRKSRRRNDV